MKNDIIYIIGLTGCGKSSLSLLLAEYLSYSFYDLDNLIEERENKSINLIFSEHGQPYFRNIESIVLESVSNKNKSVISTGGGIVVTEKNIPIMKNSGTVVFIDRNPEVIIENIDDSKRPLIKDNKNYIFEMYNQRHDLYIKASDIIFKYDKWDSDINITFKSFIKNISEYIK